MVVVENMASEEALIATVVKVIGLVAELLLKS